MVWHPTTIRAAPLPVPRDGMTLFPVLLGSTARYSSARPGSGSRTGGRSAHRPVAYVVGCKPYSSDIWGRPRRATPSLGAALRGFRPGEWRWDGPEGRGWMLRRGDFWQTGPEAPLIGPSRRGLLRWVVGCGLSVWLPHVASPTYKLDVFWVVTQLLCFFSSLAFCLSHHHHHPPSCPPPPPSGPRSAPTPPNARLLVLDGWMDRALGKGSTAAPIPRPPGPRQEDSHGGWVGGTTGRS